MLYAVGSRIDLRDAHGLAEVEAMPPAREHYEMYETGTKISFMTMAKGLILMSINEPPMRLSVAVGH